MELPEWAGRAKPVENPILEVGLVVWDDFYYGPKNGFSREQWQTLREPLYQPAMELYHRNVDSALTAALENSVGEMVRHYQDVLRLAEKHGIAAPHSHFRVEPFLFFDGGGEIPFDWHDTREEAEWVFAALESPEDGQIFDGVEQGWEVNVVADGDRLFIRHGNEDGEEFACIRCDRGALVRQVAPLRARLDRILAELRTALGADYWSRRSPQSSPHTRSSRGVAPIPLPLRFSAALRERKTP
jgi:hypothetical protein